MARLPSDPVVCRLPKHCLCQKKSSHKTTKLEIENGSAKSGKCAAARDRGHKPVYRYCMPHYRYARNPKITAINPCHCTAEEHTAPRDHDRVRWIPRDHDHVHGSHPFENSSRHGVAPGDYSKSFGTRQPGVYFSSPLASAAALLAAIVSLRPSAMILPTMLCSLRSARPGAVIPFCRRERRDQCQVVN